jgi:mycothiol synthase
MPETSVIEVTPARFAQETPRIARVAEAARSADGHPALGDAVWIDLEHPGADSAGFLTDDAGYAHIARSDNATNRATNGATNGAGNGAGNWTLGAAVVPEARARGVRGALVAAAIAHVAAWGGGLVTLWVLGATADDDTELTEAGMHPARDLYEMRVPLPLGLEPQFPSGVRVRPFEIGRDEDAWLAVNNRAFAGHAEQGDWTRATLARRIGEPWFDPTLFLLAEDDRGLVGFDWLKIHEAHDHDPRLGEIYVIGVDPRGQGSGLGRALAIAGLNAVHDHAGVDTGMLFVAADNEPALALYHALGFTVHRVDRAYECEVPGR